MLFIPQQKWRRKVIAYKTIGYLPFAEKIMDFARSVTITSRKPRGFPTSIREMLQMLQKADKSVKGKRILEIGAGWQPVLPVLFFGMGTDSILMSDIVKHMRKSYVEATVRQFIDHAREIAGLTSISQDDLELRWRKILPRRGNWVKQWLDLGITYKAPFDMTTSKLPISSFDMIYSYSCMNYIPLVQLRRIFSESTRLLVRSGWIAHNIHVYDDLQSVDPETEITRMNFLCFSEKEWDRIGNCKLHYQNRLRPSSYVALARENSFRVVYSEMCPLCVPAGTLDRAKLDEEFKCLPDEEILCRHFLLVAEKGSNTARMP
jgi:predicted small metal-binding protein